MKSVTVTSDSGSLTWREDASGPTFQGLNPGRVPHRSESQRGYCPLGCARDVKGMKVEAAEEAASVEDSAATIRVERTDRETRSRSTLTVLRYWV